MLGTCDEGGMSAQIKSKQRVADHGEVFTNEREVNAMLDMVKQETERIDSRFLEPACGDGNFISEILRRKLAVVTKRYRRSVREWEKNTFIAVASIYGVDIQLDNVIDCRNRLSNIVLKEYKKVAKAQQNPKFMLAIEFVLGRNVICGNALSMCRTDENAQDTPEPIIFSEWSMVIGNKVKRRDFRLDELLAHEQDRDNLFSSLEVPHSEWKYDPETKAFIPLPIKEYPPTVYYEVMSI